MKLETLVTKKDAQARRSIGDFVSWYGGLLGQARESRDKELRRQMLLRTGIATQFYEELFPIFTLMKEKASEWKGASIQPKLDSEKYGGDARIDFDGARPQGIPEWLQVTYAIAGEDYKFRMRHLVNHGTVCLTGPIKKRKIGGRTNVEIEPGCSTVEADICRVSALLAERIADKCSKPYPPNTALVVWVEDNGTFSFPDPLARLVEVLNRNRDIVKARFCTAFLVLTCMKDSVHELS
jgi:hypothetical protein